MNIKTDTEIRNKWSAGMDRSCDIKEIVLHGTGGPDTYNWILSGGGNDGHYYKQNIGLFHFLIERNGDIINLIDADKWVWHSDSGKHDEETIGIELLNPSAQNTIAYTDDQYKSLMFLLFNLLSANTTIYRVVSHNYNRFKYSDKNKSCPGAIFDWTKIDEMLTANDIKFNRMNDEIILEARG